MRAQRTADTPISRPAAKSPQTPVGGIPGAVLALQRHAGNSAVTRTLARRAAPPPVRTGLRASGPSTSFARAAFDFWRDPSNATKPLEAYARHLSAQANRRLAALGVPEFTPALPKSPSFAAAIFHPDLWTVELFPRSFSSDENVVKVGQMDQWDAANTAGRVYHESRHAEQWFRAARILAGQRGAESVTDTAEFLQAELEMDPDAARAAAAKPLRATPGGAIGSEAQDWYENTEGIHRIYQRALIHWLEDSATLGALADSMDQEHWADKVQRIDRLLSSWFKDSYIDFLDRHIRTIITRRMTSDDARVLSHLQAVAAEASKVKRAWEESDRTFFSWDEPKDRLKDFKAALSAFRSALHAAYKDQAQERDAWAAGGEIVVAFHKAVAAAPKPAQTGAGAR